MPLTSTTPKALVSRWGHDTFAPCDRADERSERRVAGEGVAAVRRIRREGRGRLGAGVASLGAADTERPRRSQAPGPCYVRAARPLRDEHRASKRTEGEGVQTPSRRQPNSRLREDRGDVRLPGDPAPHNPARAPAAGGPRDQVIDRRAFLGTLGLLAAPLGAEAQQAGSPRIGWLGLPAQAANADLIAGFREGLRELG